MEKGSFIDSLNAAIEGFIYVLKTQRNMRTHFLLAIFFLILGIYINLSRAELLILCASITFVLVCEMINTAMEYTIDLVKDAFHPLARVIKDVMAGAVLVSAINAVIVGYFVFFRKFVFRIEESIYKIRQSPWHITFIAFLSVLFLVLGGKVLFRKGTPMRGGMPSGHAAFAFSMWTIITLSTENTLIMLLSFIMAFVISAHRMKDQIHTFWEVFSGAVLGILATALVYQILR